MILKDIFGFLLACFIASLFSGKNGNQAAWLTYLDTSFYSFFENDAIFVKLDESDELDWITQTWLGFNYSLSQAQ